MERQAGETNSLERHFENRFSRSRVERGNRERQKMRIFGKLALTTNIFTDNEV